MATKRDAYAEQWHLGIERQLFSAMLVELEYVGSAGKHLTLCYNPNEIQPGPGTEESRRLLQPVAGVSTCCNAIRATARPSTAAR